jgi:hypothetical protein
VKTNRVFASMARATAFASDESTNRAWMPKHFSGKLKSVTVPPYRLLPVTKFSPELQTLAMV